MTELDLVPDTDRTPATLFASPDPAAIVAQATRIANEIAPLIRNQRLVKRIGQSDHVFLEGWTLAGTMLGVFPITVASGPIVHEGEVLGYQATVEARTMAGNMVGRADAQCTHDENEKWKHAPSFQLRSMAITRASSKALRMPLGFVMHLAGYDATPAEEMEQAAARGETVSGGRGVRDGWKDLGEQQRGHADVGKVIEEHGLRQWVAEWIDSKGYGPRPWAKGQLTQLRRAIEQEIHWRQQSDPPDPASPPAGGRGGSDPTSEGAASPLPSRAAASTAGPPSSRAPSDPTSPAAGRGSQSPGTTTSRPEVPTGASGRDAGPTGPAGKDPLTGTSTSAAGLSASPAGVALGVPPAGSPAADQTSGEGAMAPDGRGSPDPSPDPLSEAGEALSGSEAPGSNAPQRQAERPASGSSPTRPVSQLPGRVGGNVGSAGIDPPRDTTPGAAGVPTVDTGDPAGPTSERPIVQWFLNHPDVEKREARIHLRKTYPDEFDDIRTVGQMLGLEQARVPTALRYLSAQYDREGSR